MVKYTAESTQCSDTEIPRNSGLLSTILHPATKQFLRKRCPSNTSPHCSNLRFPGVSYIRFGKPFGSLWRRMNIKQGFFWAIRMLQIRPCELRSGLYSIDRSFFRSFLNVYLFVDCLPSSFAGKPIFLNSTRSERPLYYTVLECSLDTPSCFRLLSLCFLSAPFKAALLPFPSRQSPILRSG